MDSMLSSITTTDEVLDVETNDIANFSTYPSDTRLLDNAFHVLSPITAFSPTSTEWTFRIPKTIIPRSEGFPFRSSARSVNILLCFRYTLLSELFCSCQISIERVMTGTGAVQPLELEDNVAPIDMLGSSLFEKVEIFLNDVLVQSSNNFMNISNRLSNILSFTKEQRKTLFRLEASYPDTDDPDDTRRMLLL